MSRNGKVNLRELVHSRQFVVAPGVYDGISARIAGSMGFKAIYMTGYGTTASHLGLPDAGLATYTDMVGRAKIIAGLTDLPLIADADTGYGGLLNVRHTVRGYEEAGVAAIQIEDQEMPKKCGHTPGRRVVPMEEMVLKIRVAGESRRSEDMLIIARTDARTTLGLDEALRRAEAYRKAGADIIFVESPESAEELERIGREIDAPLLANMVPGGRTPVISAEQLQQWGFAIAIYPGVGMTAAAEAMRQAYAYLLEHGSTLGSPVPALKLEGGMHTLMGFPDVWAFEERWAAEAAE